MPVDTNVQAAVAVAGLLIFTLWESFDPFFAYFRGKTKERGKHVIRNLIIGAANSIAIALVFIGLWAWAAQWATSNEFGLLNMLDSMLPAAVLAILAVILFDMWTYLWHLMNHKVPFLWRFHRVHHSDPKMDVSTASRFHIGEIVLSSILRIPLIILLGATLWHLLLYETMMFAVVQFHHSNIAVPRKLDRFLRLFIVTPEMHKVHHSRVPEETDSNYSAFLSIWDRIYRTFRLRDKPETIEFGLDGYDDQSRQSLSGLVRMPVDRLEQRQRSR